MSTRANLQMGIWDRWTLGQMDMVIVGAVGVGVEGGRGVGVGGLGLEGLGMGGVGRLIGCWGRGELGMGGRVGDGRES